MGKAEKLKDWFTIREAASLSGLTVTMIDYLAREDLLDPAGPKKRQRGRDRRYSFSDVVMLRAFQRMLQAKLSVKRLKSALAELDRVRRTITPDVLPADLLVTDGRDVYFKRTADVLEEITSGQLTFAFVVEMNQIRQEVKKQLVIKSEGKVYRYRLRTGTTARS
jgi:DNA-binding transcriptional MerR regulator